MMKNTTDEYNFFVLSETELPALRELQNSSFRQVFKRLLRRIPPGKEEGDRLMSRFHRSGCTIMGLKNAQSELVAALCLQKAGTRALFGPLTVHATFQKPWKYGVSESLFQRVLDLSVEQGCGILDYVTFTQSVAHFNFHWHFGSPVSQAAFFVKPVVSSLILKTSNSYYCERFSSLPVSNRQSKLNEVVNLLASFWKGFDLTNDILYVHERSIGETYLVYSENKSKLLGFAICHYGNGSEAFSDEQCLVKHLYIDTSLDDARAVFDFLIGYVETDTFRNELSEVSMMVSSIRKDCVDALLSYGYEISQLHHQWMARPSAETLSVEKEAFSVFKKNQFAMSEWR